MEIEKHWNKLKKISKLSDQQLEISQHHLFSKITFINEESISTKIWLDAEKIVSGIDEDDIDFIAMTKYLKGRCGQGTSDCITD